MKQSYLNISNHTGIQPMRVLKWNIAHQLEHTHSEFMAQFGRLLQMHGLKPAINYDFSELPIYNAAAPHQSLIPCVSPQKEVTIQETFLSFVWSMCYSLLVIFGEDVEKPQHNILLGKRHVIDQQSLAGARELFRYGISLVKTYTKWDKTQLPNPEEYSQSEAFYIERANGLFKIAIGFFLCHEYAHIELGHLDSSDEYVSDYDWIIEECKADNEALVAMLKGISDHQSKVTTEVGILFGLCSLVLLKAEIKNKRHPDSDDRIETFLHGLNLDDTSPMWGFAALCFKLWDNQYARLLNWPNQVEHYKALFYHVFAQLRMRKQ
jgi:hypothetical protein